MSTGRGTPQTSIPTPEMKGGQRLGGKALNENCDPVETMVQTWEGLGESFDSPSLLQRKSSHTAVSQCAGSCQDHSFLSKVQKVTSVVGILSAI